MDWQTMGRSSCGGIDRARRLDGDAARSLRLCWSAPSGCPSAKTRRPADFVSTSMAGESKKERCFLVSRPLPGHPKVHRASVIVWHRPGCVRLGGQGHRVRNHRNHLVGPQTSRVITQPAFVPGAELVLENLLRPPKRHPRGAGKFSRGRLGPWN